MPPLTFALTIGDINGIGPEVALKAALQASQQSNVKILLVGPAAAFFFWVDHLGISRNFFQICKNQDFFIPNSKKIVIFDAVKKSATRIEMGMPTKVSGHIAAESIKTAVKLALERKVDAIVTAPISKEAFHMAGYDFPGHTEMLAHLGNIEMPVMLLISGHLRVAVATTHLALRDVPKTLSIDLIIGTVEVLAEELRNRFKIHLPRIAVTGLNPHAGEGGAFGDEEKKIILPAIRSLKKTGLAVDGPFPADALFARTVATGVYDAYLTMYHDQGLIPVKMHAAGRGVNYTCGLPFIRTSPDHGTAFDIAGKNKADVTSMMEALKLASEIAQKCQNR